MKDRNRRKELVEMYKQMKPDMGIFIIRPKTGNQYFVDTSQDLKGRINRVKFQLEAGNHPNQELQQAWNKYGPDHFTIEILEKLKYDKDESKTDYTEELEILRMVWEEKLQKANLKSYQRRAPSGN